MREIDLNTIPEKDLLNTRICDLNLCLKSSPLIRQVNDLYFELNQNEINFLPHIWLSDDWFSPDGVSGFAIPFYLAHKRLLKIQKKYLGIVEGSNKTSLLKLLRHETAHALDNAYRLRRLKERQKIFGLTSLPYPKSYIPKPNSKEYVLNLEDYYAQAHPDEDWAETFAVWLDPNSNWNQKYSNWPAIKKLNYIDSVLTSLKHKKQINFNKDEFNPCSQDTRTIKEYIKDQRQEKRLKRKCLTEKVDKELIHYIIQNKVESKKIINNYTNNRFITNKILKDISTTKPELKTSPRSRISKVKVENSLMHLTKSYIKEGRHRIVM